MFDTIAKTRLFNYKVYHQMRHVINVAIDIFTNNRL